MEDEDEGFGLIISFEDQSPSYVHGYEAGQIGEAMARSDPEIERTAHLANKTTLERAASHYGYSVEWGAEHYDTYVDAVFRKVRPAGRQRPNLSVVA